jgi:hypothetical protein
MPPSHPTLPNNQSFSLKNNRFTALSWSVIAEASNYRNTIGCSPPGERILFFEKIRFVSQKLNFSKKFKKKKSIKMPLNSLEVTKCGKKLIYSFFVFNIF